MEALGLLGEQDARLAGAHRTGCAAHDFASDGARSAVHADSSGPGLEHCAGRGKPEPSSEGETGDDQTVSHSLVVFLLRGRVGRDGGCAQRLRLRLDRQFRLSHAHSRRWKDNGPHRKRGLRSAPNLAMMREPRTSSRSIRGGDLSSDAGSVTDAGTPPDAAARSRTQVSQQADLYRGQSRVCGRVASHQHESGTLRRLRSRLSRGLLATAGRCTARRLSLRHAEWTRLPILLGHTELGTGAHALSNWGRSRDRRLAGREYFLKERTTVLGSATWTRKAPSAGCNQATRTTATGEALTFTPGRPTNPTNDDKSPWWSLSTRLREIRSDGTWNDGNARMPGPTFARAFESAVHEDHVGDGRVTPNSSKSARASGSRSAVS